MNKIIFIFIMTFYASYTTCQESLLNISHLKSFKKASKLAKEQQKPILAILYATNHSIDRTNTFEQARALIESHNFVPVVINWTSAPNKYPQKYITQKSNPTWISIHPDKIILEVNHDIQTNETLSEFLTTSHDIYYKVNNDISSFSQSKNPSDLLALAKTATLTKDTPYITKLLDDYLKRYNPSTISDDEYQQVITIGSSANPINRLSKLIKNDRDRAIRLNGANQILKLQQNYILSQLDLQGQLEPYYVWQSYEEQLNEHADSMYRRFALIYFSSIEPDKDELFLEAFDYISLYPRSPWSVLDELYEIVVLNLEKKEDFEEVYDLLVYQLSREEGYRQLDYKAYVLYKLGQQKKAIAMIDNINKLALSKGIKYKSLIYSLTSQ